MMRRKQQTGISGPRAIRVAIRRRGSAVARAGTQAGSGEPAKQNLEACLGGAGMQESDVCRSTGIPRMRRRRAAAMARRGRSASGTETLRGRGSGRRRALLAAGASIVALVGLALWSQIRLNSSYNRRATRCSPARAICKPSSARRQRRASIRRMGSITSSFLPAASRWAAQLVIRIASHRRSGRTTLKSRRAFGSVRPT